MNDTAVFLQARLASSRLPRKALLPLAGQPVVWHAMQALRLVNASQLVLLTDPESAPELGPVAEACGFALFVGDPDNVLARFVAAIHRYQPEVVVRATGDNPLVSPRNANRSIGLRARTEADYAGIVGPPLGTGVEVFRAGALLDAASRGTTHYQREHVTPALYEHRERYRVVLSGATSEISAPDLRVTIDTDDDYEQMRALFTHLYRGHPIEIPEIVSYAQRVDDASA